jgi:hypothetical protein
MQELKLNHVIWTLKQIIVGGDIILEKSKSHVKMQEEKR